MRKQPLPPPRVIAVDVDGTLIVNGGINARVVSYCQAKHADGWTLLLWSTRGEQHARKAAQEAGIAHLFEHILSKPGHIVDDKGWTWVRFTKIVRRLI